MAKKYLIMERGFEYNDENYNLTEFGDPKLIFSDKTKATNECKKLSIEWFKEKDFYEYYGESIDYIFKSINNEQELAEILKLKYKKTRYGNIIVDLPEQLNEFQLNWIINNIREDYNPYYIVEIEYVE